MSNHYLLVFALGMIVGVIVEIILVEIEEYIKSDSDEEDSND